MLFVSYVVTVTINILQSITNTALKYTCTTEGASLIFLPRFSPGLNDRERRACGSLGENRARNDASTVIRGDSCLFFTTTRYSLSLPRSANDTYTNAVRE